MENATWMISCYACNREIANTARVCPHCGAPRPPRNPTQQEKNFVIGLTLVLAIPVGIFAFWFCDLILGY